MCLKAGFFFFFLLQYAHGELPVSYEPGPEGAFDNDTN